MVGMGLTITSIVAVLLQPAPDDPVTVYVVVVDGLTLILVPEAPVLQLYVVAPFPVKVELLPKQILLGVAVILTVGTEETVTVTEAVFVQPAALVPVTV